MLLSCHHIPVPKGPTGNPNTQSIHISSYWDYVQSGTGLHKNTGLKETDPVELTWIISPTPHLLTQNAHPSLPTPATLQWEVSLRRLSGWCIWRRALPHPRLTGRYSRARTPVLSRACPASFWTPLSQFRSSCRYAEKHFRTMKGALKKCSILMILTADQASLWAWQQAWRMNKAWRLPETAWWSLTCVHSLKKKQTKKKFQYNNLKLVTP